MTHAYPIITIDINDFKLNQSRKFGATHTINSSRINVRKKILEILPDGIDVCVDTTGIKTIRELSYELTSKDGRTILVGVPQHGEKMNIDSFQLHFTKGIKGSHGGDTNPSYDIPRLIRLHEAGKYNLNEMISYIYSLDEINKAIEMVRNGNVVRCLIKMDKQ